MCTSMKIRRSKYNSPFVEPPQKGVHYISKDHQFLMDQGFYDSHITAYYSHTSLPLISKPFLDPSLDLCVNTIDDLASFGVKAVRQVRHQLRGDDVRYV